MIIQRMKSEDIEQILELENKLFTDSWSENVFHGGIQNPHYEYLVAKDGSVIIGYLSFFYILPEGEIQRIAVNPDYQSRGIGAALIKDIVSFSKKQGITDISLEVRSSNTAALSLYERSGFVKEGIRKGYYQAPVEDGIIMWNRGI